MCVRGSCQAQRSIHYVGRCPLGCCVVSGQNKSKLGFHATERGQGDAVATDVVWVGRLHFPCLHRHLDLRSRWPPATEVNVEQPLEDFVR